MNNISFKAETIKGEIIEADYSYDEKLLKEVKKFKNK